MGSHSQSQSQSHRHHRHHYPKPHCLSLFTNLTFLFMASLSLLSFFFFFLLSISSSLSSSRHHNHPPTKPPTRKHPPVPAGTSPAILQACQATRFPDICQASLNHVPPDSTPLQIIQSAISLSSTNLVTAQSMVKSILDSSAGSPNRTNAASNCLELLANSRHRLSSPADAAVKDARTWTSAALLFQYDCWNALKYANDTSLVDRTMAFLASLSTLTSNALSMIVSYDIYGNDTARWNPPKTERDGFWEKPGSVGGDSGFRGGFPRNLAVNVVVCKDGGNSKSNGCFKTVQEAVNTAPDNRPDKKFVIHIKEGVYEEIVRVPLEKRNVVFIGDGMGKTIITGSLSVGQPGVATYNTATVVPEHEIHLACNATRHPETCQSSLIQSNHVPSNPTPVQIIQSAFWVSSQNLKTARSMLESILGSSENENLTNAAKDCLEVLSYSQYRISLSNDTLPHGEIKNVRAWMSAALSYQTGCYGGLRSRVGDIASAKETILFLENLINLTSNALSMMVSYDLFGNETRLWQPPQTERDGFWEVPGRAGAVEYKGGFPSNLSDDVIVCKVGNNGCYRTVQEAVNAAPDNKTDCRFVIRIKEGVYEEIVRVPLQKKNVVFLGDGIGKTVITGSKNAGQLGVTTFESATVGVLGDGFMASGLTIQNTAGAPTHQAVALRVDSDLSVIENCELLGNQDTLYAHSLRQYYKSCRIVGNVDFIFGNSAAIFEGCQILVKPRQEKPEKGESNAVTAHGRTDPAQSTGFVFKNCLINGTEEYMALYHGKPSVHKNFLGRPWKEFSRVVFINCNFEVLISPQGWLPWSGDFALKTLYYGEFGNSGPGSNTAGRVSWSSQIPSEHVNAYSVENFIQGNEWIPNSS